MNDHRVLLFDLGGVLVEASGQVALQGLLPHLDKTEILERWHSSEAVGLFERGKITPDEFSAKFVLEWQVSLKPAEFLNTFTSWVVGYYPGAKALLERLRGKHTLACLSNTNAAHWARLPDVGTDFDVCIASHLTGYMKPDRLAFTHAVQALRVPAEAIYFFDDLSANVEAARNVGIQAFQVRGVYETEAALRSCGIDCDVG
jgi:glucose-1-phosphatase